jgi:hypothetical protein
MPRRTAPQPTGRLLLFPVPVPASPPEVGEQQADGRCPSCQDTGYEPSGSQTAVGVRELCHRCRSDDIRRYQRDIGKSQMRADWNAPTTQVWYPHLKGER